MADELEDDDDGSDPGAAPLISFIALDDMTAPDEQKLLEQIRSDWPSLLAPDAKFTHEDGSLVIDTLDGTCFISHVAAPIPWDDLAFPCAAAWYWTEAEERLKNHQSHLIVVATSDDPDPLEKHVVLTRIAASTLAVCKAAGVSWAGRLVLSPDLFAEVAKESLNEDALPVDLWIYFGGAAEADGTSSFYTSGLETFGFPELEVHSTRLPPEGVLALMNLTTQHVLGENVILEDGDTVGLDDEQKIKISRQTSRFDEELDVNVLELVES